MEIPTTYQSQTPPQPTRKNQPKAWLIAVACVLMLGIGGLSSWLFLEGSGPIPRRYTRNLSLTLYYPNQLPSGYSVDRKSFERKGDKALIYTIKAPGGKRIGVSEQSVPTDILQRTKPQTPFPIPGERDFNTAIGRAYISLWGDKYVADIVADKGTWIILNVTGFTADEAAKIAQSFSAIK